MCLLPHSRLLLLVLLFLFRWRRPLSCRECLSRLANGALYALRGFRFRRSRFRTRRGSLVMLGHFHHDVTRPLLVAERPAHRRGTNSLPSRPFVHEACRHKKRIHVTRVAGILGFALGVCDGASQNLFYFPRHALLCEPQRLQRIFRAMSADQIDYQARLFGRDAKECRFRDGLNFWRSLMDRSPMSRTLMNRTLMNLIRHFLFS